MLHRLSMAAKELGVTTRTLRAWDKSGKIKCVRTESGHRRVPQSEIERLKGTTGRTVALVYARCSTQKQVDNLERQVGRLLEYANKTGYKVELYKDIGSGLNENRKQFCRMMKRISSEEVACVIVEYKDRISRYGFETFRRYCESLKVQVTVLRDAEPKGFEQELAEDMIALIASFSAKLYGRRSHIGRKKKETPDAT